MLRRALLISLDCSTLHSIRTLYCRVLSKEVSSTIFKVFGMTRPGIEPRSTGSLANTLPTRPIGRSGERGSGISGHDMMMMMTLSYLAASPIFFHCPLIFRTEAFLPCPLQGAWQSVCLRIPVSDFFLVKISRICTAFFSFLQHNSVDVALTFTYLGSSVESTEKDIETRLAKAWTAIGRLSIIWKSDLTDKMKRSFFQAAVTSILLYGCTT